MNQLLSSTQFSKMLTQSSPGFGVLSQHSFFSRHNPHPNRVRHIQGLNGRPICTVRDDWLVASSLYPHPLLRSNVPVIKRAAESLFTPPCAPHVHEARGNKSKSAFLSEAWRDELKELAAKVSQASQTQNGKKEEEELACRRTRYSAETGRIIPPSSSSYQRKSQSQSLKHPQPLHDAELMVLELLCQILQTDSLSSVQQWLLLAGQREKELVMGMVTNALDGVDVAGRNRQSFQPLQVFHTSSSTPAYGYGPSIDPPWRRARRTSTRRTSQTLNEKPERIGVAEILEVHKTF
ncbi:protein TBATA [Cololabis saira]|uniref:protein TBATA n=1 Tax=Cololabis saira TaxID=129043 RepID=UPI002AD2B57F|nr:protein TBATA [Cololabis saira]